MVVGPIDASGGGSGARVDGHDPSSTLSLICAKLKQEKARQENRLRAISPTQGRASSPMQKDFSKQLQDDEQSDSIRQIRRQHASDLGSLLERTRLSAERLMQPESKNICTCKGTCSCDFGSVKSIDSILEELERQADMIADTSPVAASTEDTKDFEQTIEHLRSEGALAHSEKQEALAKVATLEACLAEKAGIIQDKCAAIEAFEKKLALSETSRTNDIKEAVDKVKKELHARIQLLESSLQDQKSQTTKAGELACRQENRIKILEGQVKHEQSEAAKAKVQSEDMSSRQTHELDVLKQQVDRANLKEEELRRNLSELQSQLLLSSDQQKDLKEDHARKSVELEALASELEDVRLQLQKNANRSVTEKAPLSSLQQAAMESKIRTEIEMKNAPRIKELECMIGQLQRDNQCLKEQSETDQTDGKATALETIEGMKKDICELETELQVSRQTVEAAETQLAESKLTIDALREKLATRESEKGLGTPSKPKEVTALEASILVQRKKLSFLKASGHPVEACKEKLMELEKELASTSTENKVKDAAVLLDFQADAKSDSSEPSPLFVFNGASLFTVDELKTALVETERKIEDLEDEITARNKYSAEQAAKMMHLTGRIAQLENSTKQLTDSKRVLEKEVAAVTQTLSEKESYIANLEKSNEDQQAEMKLRDEDLDKARTELQTLAARQDEIEMTRNEQAALSKKIEEEIEDLKREVSEREAEILKLQNVNAEMRCELESEQKHSEVSCNDQEVLFVQSNEAKENATVHCDGAETNRVQDDVKLLKREIMEKEALISQLQALNDNNKTEIESLRASLDRATTDLEKLQANEAEVETTNDADTDVQGDITEAHDETDANGVSSAGTVSAVQVPAEASTDSPKDDQCVVFSLTEVTQLKEALEEAKKEKVESAQFSATIKRLKAELSEKDKLLVGYEQRINDLERNIDSLNGQSRQLEKTVSNCEKAIIEIESELEAATNEARMFEDRAKEADTLRRAVASKDAELEKRALQVETLTVKLQTLTVDQDQSTHCTQLKVRPFQVRRGFLIFVVALLVAAFAILRAKQSHIETSAVKPTIAQPLFREQIVAEANTTITSQPLEAVHEVAKIVETLPESNVTVEVEPMFVIRPVVAQSTNNALHSLLQSSPSATYEAANGPVDPSKFKFMKTFRKVAAKTFDVSVQTVRKVASHLDEIAVHTHAKDSDFAAFSKAGATLGRVRSVRLFHPETIRSVVEQVAYTQLVQDIHPPNLQEWTNFLPGRESVAAAVFEASQFDNPMLWRPVLLPQQLRNDNETSLGTNRTLVGNHTTAGS